MRPHLMPGLDVYEDEPLMAPGLAECQNAVLLPHIASATLWTRSGMVRRDCGRFALLICMALFCWLWIGAYAQFPNKFPTQAKLAACNVVGVLKNYPVWNRPDDTLAFVDADPTSPLELAPSILNAADLGLAITKK